MADLILANGQIVDYAYINRLYDKTLVIEDVPRHIPVEFNYSVREVKIRLPPSEITRLQPVVRKSAWVVIDMIPGYDYSTVVREPSVDAYEFIRTINNRHVAPTIRYLRTYVLVFSKYLVIPRFPWPTTRVEHTIQEYEIDEYDGMNVLSQFQEFLEYMKGFDEYILHFQSPIFRRLVWKQSRFSIYFNRRGNPAYSELFRYLRDTVDTIRDVDGSVMRTRNHLIQEDWIARPEDQINLPVDGRWVIRTEGTRPIPRSRIPLPGFSPQQVRLIQEILLVLASVRTIPRLNDAPVRLLTRDLQRLLADYFM
jgi:hypothetical protein